MSQIKEAGVRVLFQPIFRRARPRHPLTVERYDWVMTKVNRIMRSRARSFHCFYHVLNTGNVALSADGIHLSPAGYDRIFRAVFEQVLND